MSTLKKIVFVVMALTLLVTGVSTPILNANAQSIDESVGIEFEQMNNTASKSSDIEDPKKIQNLTDMSKEAISSKQIVLNYSNAD